MNNNIIKDVTKLARIRLHRLITAASIIKAQEHQETNDYLIGSMPNASYHEIQEVFIKNTLPNMFYYMSVLSYPAQISFSETSKTKHGQSLRDAFDSELSKLPLHELNPELAILP